MPLFQRVIQAAQRVVPRGWAPVVKLAARVNPALRRYPAALRDGDRLLVDLRQSMCLGYFFHGELRHDVGVERLLRAALREGSVFVDVGANIGYYVGIAGRLVGPAGHVYAVEPLPAAVELLRGNLAGLPHATLLPLAVGEHAGEADLFARERGDLSSLDPATGADPAAAGTPVRVRLSTLDRELAGARRVDVVKIDVEGFELEVLRGAVETIRKHQPLVAFEYNEVGHARGIRLADYVGFFRELGYALHWVGTTREGPLTSPIPGTDVVAVPPSWAHVLGPTGPALTA